MRRLPSILAMLASLALVPAAGAQRYVPTEDPKWQRIRYPDSLTSVNDRCAVARQKLNLRVRAVYVNGLPIGFC